MKGEFSESTSYKGKNEKEFLDETLLNLSDQELLQLLSAGASKEKK